MKRLELQKGISALIAALILGLSSMASAQNAYEAFAGYVTGTGNAAVANGRVTINNLYSTTTGADGYFELYVPASAKYVINVVATNHVPHSEVYAGPGLLDMRVQLTPAETFTIDTTRPVSVTDSRGSRILLPVDALVDASGRKPSGPILMTVHTYDLRNERMVGDMSGLDVNGQPVVLLSVGAISVDFTDSAGNRYNLAAGKKATLSLLTDPGNSYSGPIPMWWYDTSRGLWIEEGQGLVQNGVATADVSHFTVWNFDAKFSTPSCVRITVDPMWFYVASGGFVRIRVTSPSPWYSVYSLPINSPGTHVIYNVENNVNLQFDILRPGTTDVWDPYAIVNTGGPWGGTGRPNPSEFGLCRGAVTLNGVPTAGKLTGQVRRQHRSLHGGATVAVSVGGSTFSTTTDSSGNFSVLVPTGSGSAKASLTGYLPAQRSSVSATAGATVTLPTVTLLAGDVDNNLCINASDTGAINSAIGSAASTNDPRNINGDTWIYYDDLGLAARELHQTATGRRRVLEGEGHQGLRPTGEGGGRQGHGLDRDGRVDRERGGAGRGVRGGGEEGRGVRGHGGRHHGEGRAQGPRGNQHMRRNQDLGQGARQADELPTGRRRARQGHPPHGGMAARHGTGADGQGRHFGGARGHGTEQDTQHARQAKRIPHGGRPRRG
ncbi:MAG TPA: carboxypeptidase regulatory-like domain-containing protein [Archangium sp.]|nr:carboxypeptidase regulatory-like domain-containing protein [Archangium sp.]